MTFLWNNDINQLIRVLLHKPQQNSYYNIKEYLFWTNTNTTKQQIVKYYQKTKLTMHDIDYKCQSNGTMGMFMSQW